MNRNKKSKYNSTNIVRQKFYITRGIYKGLQLFLESNATTRPTKALVKKSFFDTMQNSIKHRVFVECFAGSGQVGFEALSMGAKKLLLFEYDAHAYDNLSSNVTIFKEKSKSYKIQQSSINHSLMDSKILQENIYSYNIDFFSSLPILNSHLKESKKSFNQNDKMNNFITKNDIISRDFALNVQESMQDDKFVLYLDPPFNCREGFCNIYTKITNFIESFNKDLLEQVDCIIIEKRSDAIVSCNLSIFSLAKISKFGKTSLVYFKK